MSAARALPVTPAERACATVLRAYLAWNFDHTTAPLTVEHGTMLRLGDFLATEGLVIEDVGDPTDAGRDLLARVEAADPMIAFEAAIRDAARRGGPYCITHTRAAVAALDAARLAGATPIAAPPAKEPR